MVAISDVTIVKKMCVPPSTFRNGQVGLQIRHLLNHPVNLDRRYELFANHSLDYPLRMSASQPGKTP
jgi:hypothetical protein